jgi:hypothetical protein
MGIKRYVLFSLLFVVAVGVYVFTFEGSTLAKDFFGLSISLPIAVWVVVPTIALMIASVIHMVYYYVKAYARERAVKKDYDAFVELTKARILEEKSNVQFKTEVYDLPVSLVTRVKLRPDVTAEGIKNDELAEAVETISKIDAGEVVELKKYKLGQENPLVLKNKLNQLVANPKLAPEFLKSCDTTESELCQKAEEMLLSTASYAEIKRFEIDLSEPRMLALLARHADKEDALHIEDTELEALVKNPILTKQGLIEAAKILQPTMNPDALVAFFEKLYNARIEACEAFLYVLFELQMIDRAREVLENSDDDELEKFKLLLFLRDHGKHCDTSFFL